MEWNYAKLADLDSKKLLTGNIFALINAKQNLRLKKLEKTESHGQELEKTESVLFATKNIMLLDGDSEKEIQSFAQQIAKMLNNMKDHLSNANHVKRHSRVLHLEKKKEFFAQLIVFIFIVLQGLLTQKNLGVKLLQRSEIKGFCHKMHLISENGFFLKKKINVKCADMENINVA